MGYAVGQVLLSEAETSNELTVPVDIFPSQVVEQTSALSDQLQ
jgi:hypothetical protein